MTNAQNIILINLYFRHVHTIYSKTSTALVIWLYILLSMWETHRFEMVAHQIITAVNSSIGHLGPRLHSQELHYYQASIGYSV